MFLNLKSFMCLFGVMLLMLVWPIQAQFDINNAGIIQVMGEKQYFIQRTAKVNFYKALQICAALNMTLASIESATEQRNLINLLTTNSILSRQYWLSGNDLPLSKEFVWFGTGNLFSYTSWASGVRNNLSQRCIRTDGNFNWRRDSCNSLQYFICEKPVAPLCNLDGKCLAKPLIVF